MAAECSIKREKDRVLCFGTLCVGGGASEEGGEIKKETLNYWRPP